MRYFLLVLVLYGSMAAAFFYQFMPHTSWAVRSADTNYHMSLLQKCIVNLAMKQQFRAKPFSTVEGEAFMSALGQPGGYPRILELSPEEFTVLAVLVGLRYKEITCIREEIYEPKT